MDGLNHLIQGLQSLPGIMFNIIMPVMLQII